MRNEKQHQPCHAMPCYAILTRQNRANTQNDTPEQQTSQRTHIMYCTMYTMLGKIWICRFMGSSCNTKVFSYMMTMMMMIYYFWILHTFIYVQWIHFCAGFNSWKSLYRQIKFLTLFPQHPFYLFVFVRDLNICYIEFTIFFMKICMKLLCICARRSHTYIIFVINLTCKASTI